VTAASAGGAGRPAAADHRVPLRYILDAATSVLVDPRTGTVVSLARAEQALRAAPDPIRFRSIQTILARPRYAKDPVLRLAGVAFAHPGQAPPGEPRTAHDVLADAGLGGRPRTVR